MVHKSNPRQRRSSAKAKPSKPASQSDDSLPKPEDLDLEHLYDEQKSSL